MNELKELYETINVEVQPIWRRLSVKDKKKNKPQLLWFSKRACPTMIFFLYFKHLKLTIRILSFNFI